MPDMKPFLKSTSEDKDKVQDKNTEVIMSFFSRLAFARFYPVALRGYREALELRDLLRVSPENETHAVWTRFEREWLRTRSDGIKTATAMGRQSRAAVLTSLLLCNWEFIAAGIVCRFIQDLVSFSSPWLLDLLITHADSDDEAAWKGYLYAAMLFVFGMMRTLLWANHVYNTDLVGMRARTAITAAVFRKSLTASSAARCTIGKTVNLVNVDTEQLIKLSSSINDMWSEPLRVLVAFYFLWRILGMAMLSGAVVMGVLIPIDIRLTTLKKQYQQRHMKVKDERLELTARTLMSMKVLKLYAWEPAFEQRVTEVRDREIKLLRAIEILKTAAVFIWSVAPLLMSLSTFATYLLVQEDALDARKLFLAVTYFNMMRQSLKSLPIAVGYAVAAGVSLDRINGFLNAEDEDPNNISHRPETNGNVISIQNGTFGLDDTIILRNINIKVRTGSLVAIIGQVGSGKSSLLAAIFGQMNKLSGTVNTIGSFAYVAQEAWIQNATVRENILFGSSYNQARYEQVLEACALIPDVAMMPGGDGTEIGEKGVNISGGQKQRISLARAAYNDAEVYFLDDPLSAVDVHVGNHLFEHVIGPRGMLCGKTRLFVTHSVTYLPKVDQIVVFDAGEIRIVGTFQDIVDQRGDFPMMTLNQKTLDTGFSGTVESVGATKEAEYPAGNENDDQINNNITKQDPNRVTLKKEAELMSVERLETGGIRSAVYKYLFQALGSGYVVSATLLLLSMQGSLSGSNIWLAEWSAKGSLNTTTDNVNERRSQFIYMYAALGFCQAITSFLGIATMALGLIRASRLLHSHMLGRIVRAPMSFFDTTPIGRILNRFSKDFDTVDTGLGLSLRNWFIFTLQMIGTFVAITYSTPAFVVPLVPAAILYYVILRFYRASSQQLHRLESQSRSVVNSVFGEAIAGITTIRAFGAQERFTLKCEEASDLNQMAYYSAIVGHRWLDVRLETISNFLTFLSALFVLINRSSGSFMGLSVSNALMISEVLGKLIRAQLKLEGRFIAVERIKEYSEVAQEAPWDLPERQSLLPCDWPSEGAIKFDNYQLRYRQGLDLTLRGITCSIYPKEKIGIVGRTGAGKSSLTLALFRIVEAAGGSLEIDGVDVSHLGLHTVRRSLTIIPQDPVLFPGSLRMNLDPFEKYSDDALWQALESVQLKAFVSSLPSGLNHCLSESGENLSFGQRQLICLARALLRKTKILVLDEATAGMDLETDQFIRRVIQTEFADCTVITVAHRLNTIMESTRVMVLDQGVRKEFASPQELLADNRSMFYSMAKDAGLV